MEPERNIEKLLRALGKKRRHEAGDAFKLHPATRRLLQGEVARRRPKTADAEEDSAPTLWTLFRQRLAFVLSVVFILFISAALLLPSLSASKRKAQSIAAVNNLKEIGLATKTVAEANDGRLPATLDSLTNELASDKVLFDPATGKKFAYLGDGKNLNELQSNAVLAYSTEDKKGRAVLLADGSVTYARKDQFQDMLNRSQPQPLLAQSEEDSARQQIAEAPVPAATPPPVLVAKSEPQVTYPSAANGVVDEPVSRKPEVASAQETEKSLGVPIAGTKAATGLGGAATDTFASAATTPARDRSKLDLAAKTPTEISGSNRLLFGATQHFTQEGAITAQNLFKNTANKTKALPVLVNFEVQQNGNAISVVDADGSVYRGTFDTEIAVAQNQSGGENMNVAPGASSQTYNKDSGVAQKLQSALVNNAFRVSGLNQTLKQNVVFTGNLLELTTIATTPQSNTQSFSGGTAGSGGGGGGPVGQSKITSPNQNQDQSQVFLWSNARITGTAVINKTNLVEVNAVPLAP